MYRNNHRHKKLDHVIYFDSGGLGDLIAALPVIQYILNNFKHINLEFWVPDYAYTLVKRSLNGKYSLKKFGELEDNNIKPKPGQSFAEYQELQLAMHLTDVASTAFLNTTLSSEDKNYLPVNTKNVNIEKFQLPEKYVVMTTAHTTEVREFLPEKVNEITKFCKEKGYEIVFLGKHQSPDGKGFIIEGKTNHEIDYSIGLDLLDQTSLIEAVAIMKNAKTIIGLDNGLLHLAATTEVPIVAGFTTVDPKHREPWRHNEQGWNWYSIVPPASLKCRGCQSNWSMDFNVDFRKCFYKENNYDTVIQCIKQLPTEQFIYILDKIL